MKSFPPFQLDELNQCVWQGETRVSLMPKPFAVLQYLVEHPGKVVTHEELLAAIWPDTYVQPEVLRRYILEIRRALRDTADAPRFIQTLPKRGYQFIADVTDDSGAPEDDAAAQTTLVGRDSALADLRRFLTAASQGRRQVVFVVGEAGIGKTSLVDAFQRVCGSSANVAVARGQSVEGFGGKEAYYPVLEAIGQLARSSWRALLIETLTRTAPTWLVQFPALVMAGQQATLQREIAGATRDRMVRELCEVLELITERIPLVLILEDLHWVDRATLDALSAIARRRETARLLVVGTLRPAELILSDSPLKALKHDLLVHRLMSELHLERLQESDVATYISATYAPGDLPPSLPAMVYRHSDGNPLFMVAILDHLAKKRILTRDGNRWTMTMPVGRVGLQVPDTLKQMLEIQLHHASEREQQLLKAASVAGQHFTAWSVATMLDDDPSMVDQSCQALADRQQFLRFSGTRELASDISSAEYRFTHALYREVLYRRLNPTERTVFHRRLANGLENLRSSDADMAAEIALHFEQGHEYGHAIHYLVLAAETATRRYAHQESATILEHARELIAKVPPKDAPALDLRLLERLGNAYYALGDIQRSARTYESMAVRAADAGLLASQADALTRLPHQAESVPFFLKAIELDSTLASAYTTLSRIYSNLGEGDRAKGFARLAYERRDHADERERLSITYQYHYEVTGDQTRAAEVLDTWKRSYPLDFQPVNSLALIHNFLGDFARGVEEGTEAVRRNHLHGYPYSNLAHAYRGLGRFADAKRTAEEAVALQIETLPTRRLLYQLAVASGQHDEAARHRAWARDKPREFDMIGAEAQAAAWAGKVRDARQLYEEAAHLADTRKLPDVASSHLAWGISMDLAYGNVDAGCALARRVLTRNPSYDPRLRAAMGLRGSAEASTIANELAAANPHHTMINGVLLPMLKGAIALDRLDPARAIEELAHASCYELGFIAALAPVHLRGQAYLMLGDGTRAAAQFQRILNHRGSDPFSPFHAVALVGLARAYAMQGKMAESRAAYEQFLAAWRDADPDVPILVAARDECARLAQVH